MQTVWEYPAGFDLEAAISNGAEIEMLKSYKPEKGTLHPASKIVHVNGQYI
jgi:hypothetical protein